MSIDALDAFYDGGWITDVLHPVKSGKEATVYCCRAHPGTGRELLAAKVYRSTHDRVFRADAIYREGRVIVNRRTRRAVEHRTAFGRRAASASWVSAEFETLTLLYEAGADVVRPLARGDGAILLEWLGDATTPAPMLRNVVLPADQAHQALAEVLRNVELFLACDRIHSDLSPYNILYWKGRLTIIDFPQAIDPRFNPNALALLTRDLENVARYFSRYGVETNAAEMALALWTRFLRAEL
jgi:RIO kinase 1